MRITWQRDTDMVYIQFADTISPGEAIAGMVNLDLDASGRLLGMELGDASRLLPREILDRAEKSP